MSDWKKWRSEAKEWALTVAALYEAGKISIEVYNNIRARINRVEQLATETEEAGFPEDVELGVELAAEGAEVGAEVAALVAA